MSLLNTKTGYTTPWHCSVALMADGEWISATMGDFKKDPRLEIVHEDGRPSYFQEKTCELHDPIDGEKLTNNQRASEQLDRRSAGLVSNTEAAVEKPREIMEEKLQHQLSTSASSYLDKGEEEKLTELAGTLSYPVFHARKIINPFF